MPGSKAVGRAQPQSVDELFAQFMKALERRSLIADFGIDSSEVRDYQAMNPRWRQDERVYLEIVQKTRRLKKADY